MGGYIFVLYLYYVRAVPIYTKLSYDFQIFVTKLQQTFSYTR